MDFTKLLVLSPSVMRPLCTIRYLELTNKSTEHLLNKPYILLQLHFKPGAITPAHQEHTCRMVVNNPQIRLAASAASRARREGGRSADNRPYRAPPAPNDAVRHTPPPAIRHHPLPLAPSLLLLLNYTMALRARSALTISWSVIDCKSQIVRNQSPRPCDRNSPSPSAYVKLSNSL